MVLIRTRGIVTRRALLASALGVAWLSAGCGDSGKSDGQIPASPEAANAAQEASKSISEQMAKKYKAKK
jgi:hypothetical protein